jgi:peptidase M23-like protein
MKFFLPLFVFSLFLTSCAPAQNVAALPDATAIVILPEATAVSISPSPTAEPTKIPCDPLTVDYCITDGHFILQRPIAPSANDSVDITYRYASTENGTRVPHHGVEFLNKYGTPVQAAADGVVVFAGPDAEAVYSPWVNFYGNLIVLKHDNDLYTLYAHLSKIDVKVGDAVLAGQKIGEVGQSGVATGSHLHFEVRRGDVRDYFATQNPELWLAPKRDERNLQYGTLMISVVDGLSHYLFAELTIARYLGSSDKPEKTFYLDTYVDEMAKGDENAAMSGLQFGRYRIALKLNGQLYERWVEVQSGKLTQTVIIVK